MAAPQPYDIIAFAVYSADDNSLTFYKNYESSSISPGAIYNGKTVTAIYTGIENTNYTVTTDQAWNAYNTVITSVSFEDEITPTSTAFWFFGFTNLIRVDNTANLITSNVTSMRQMFTNCSSLVSLDVSNWNTSRVTDMRLVFYNCAALTNLNVASWDTSNVTIMTALFTKCSSLPTVDISNWNIKNVTSMGGMFENCNALTTLNITNWNTSNVTDMSYMFNHCNSLSNLNIGNWDIHNVTTLRTMFQDCGALVNLNVSNWNTENVVDMAYMFYKCSALTTLDVSNWNTSKVTNMSYMFHSCFSLTALDVSNWDTGNVTNMNRMFTQGAGDYGKTHAPISVLDVSNWNTSKVTDMGFMFYGFRGPKTVDVSKWDVSNVNIFDHMFAWSHLSGLDVSKWDTSSATNMGALFHTIDNVTLDVSSFDTSNVTVFSQMFENNHYLENLIGLETFDTSKGIDFQDMFSECFKLKSLNLSSFDTRNAVDNEVISTNGGTSKTCYRMFNRMDSLEEITLGENFRFNGNGTTSYNVATLPTPSTDYIEYADGKWYSADGVAYNPSEVPNGAGTYYATAIRIPKRYAIKMGTLKHIANAVREKTTITDEILTENLPEAILSIKGSVGGTATAAEIFLDKTAYVNGEEITGEFTIDTELNEQDNLLNQIETALTNKVGGDFDAGYKAFYDEFWDNYQENGNKINYNNAFANLAWNDTTFKPKYDIRPVAATRIFSECGITNMKTALQRAGVVLDFSKTTTLTFITESSTCAITVLPELNFTSLGHLKYLFNNATKIQSIDKIILKSDGSQEFSSTSFNQMVSLTEIRFEGVIGKTVTFQHSKLLSKASIESIISCLSTTSSGQTLTLNKTAVNKAFETSTGANDGSTSAEWNLLINGDGTTTNPGRTNWTITLV